MDLDQATWSLVESMSRRGVVEEGGEEGEGKLAIHQVVSHLERVPKAKTVGGVCP